MDQTVPILEWLTGILVIITGFYAYFTYRILKANEGVVKAMNDQLREITRPYVTIRPITFPKSHMIYLCIENTGKTSANHLRMEVDRDFFSLGRDGHNLKDLNAFKQEIASLPPGTRLLYYLGTVPVIFGQGKDEAKTPPVFKVTAHYQQGGKTFEEPNQIDLYPYLMEVAEPDALIDSIEDLAKKIEAVGRLIERYLNIRR